jgi:D-glycero-alpha-D-manno-heptose-7-phosphate kinase
MVALIAVLREWLKLDLSPYDLAELAYRVERQDLQLAGGRQDQYAAAFGGFNYIEFDAQGTVVTPLRLRRDTLEELEYRLLLCYMGQTRQSARIIERQTKGYTSGRSGTVEGLHALKAQTAEMKRALLLGHVDGFGELLHEAWVHKKKLAEGITTPHVDRMYEVARREGALGGKMTGAGGGGYFLFLTRFDRRHRVAAALEKLGGQVVPFQFESRGVRSWPVAHER